MSKIERYAGNLRAFGSNAQGLERTLFGETTQADDLTSQVTNSFLRGWGIVGPSENPSMEDFNAAMYTMSQFIAYQHQMGIPEWDALQEYYSASICVRNGEAYLSLVDSNIGSAPPSAKWTSVLTAKNALANLSGFLKSSNNLSEIKDAGPAAVAQTLANLGLGDAFTASEIAATPWVNLTLSNGWTTYPDLKCAYRKVLGLVFVEVNARNGTFSDGTILATLPVGYRPAKAVIAPVLGQSLANTVPARVSVNVDGAIVLIGFSSAATAGLLFNFSLQ
ncbi:hypothetical protein [Yersinia mollaretii]|uniref:hypothetical protein n=1 Tax=Yersinia mollaretii TaxID=33060 RepID=UPI0021BD9719|nr:hypothetical protein [Yersinia mollaretii]